MLRIKYLFLIAFFLQCIYSYALSPTQNFLYLTTGERYELIGSLTASYDGPYHRYANRYEIVQNELFANNASEQRRFLFFWVWKRYRQPLKVDWFSGFIILTDSGYNRAEIYENYKIFVFENGNLIREMNMNHDEYIELRDRELNLYRNSTTFNDERTFDRYFRYSYFIRAYLAPEMN
jgi:hypothetical protein